MRSCWVTLLCVMKTLAVLVLLLAAWMYFRRPKEWEELEFKAVRLAEAPQFTGPLTVNDKLAQAEILHEDRFGAPESFLIEGDTLYVSVHNGIVKIVGDKVVKQLQYSNAPECINSKPHPGCSRPLGIRRLDENRLIFADGNLGLVTLDFEKEEFKVLIHSGDIGIDKPISFIDDVDVVDADTVIFTDACWLHRMHNMAPAFMGGLATGRVYMYEISTKKFTLLMDKLHFANGIQLLPDRESFIVSETLTARVLRHYVAGAKKGQTEVFVENLPGHPDNIRLSSDGQSVWMALCVVRQPNGFRELDFIMASPKLRWFFYQIVPHSLWLRVIHSSPQPDAYGMAVQTDLEGRIVRSFHAPKGRVNNLSQLSDDGRSVYVGSYLNPFLAKFPLSD